MSVWTGDVVPVRRSSRRLSVSGSDVESIASGLTTPVKQTPRKLMHPKSSMIPRLKQIEEKMASSDDEIIAISPSSEQKRGRGRPRKDSPGRPKMTAIKTAASSAAAVKDAAAAATPSARKEKTPPRSRSSSRTRKTTTVPSTASSSPSKTPAVPKIPSVLNFDESPVVTRRSTRIAGKTPAVNGHANGSSVQTGAKTTQPSVGRFSTEKWRVQFTEKHPFLTKILIPALICLVYAVIIIAVGVYFNVHKKAPIWMDMAAQRVNDIYDDFWARRAAAAAANAASAAKSEI